MFKKIICIIAALLVALSWICGQYSENGIKPGSKQFLYGWNDLDGNSYITIHSNQTIDTTSLFPGTPGLKFQKVNKKVPLKHRAGYRIQTYRLTEEITESSNLTGSGKDGVIYLIGETHLGKSQEEVAKILCKLIKEKEIDAVLLEQPSNLKFEWSKYRRLERQPEKAIAALQQRMLSDASRDMNESGQDYIKSQYISAVDYFYIMINLQGLRIPFYNIESPILRDGLKKSLLKGNKPDEVIAKYSEPRDKEMARLANSIISKKKYNQAILICGAKHLDSLKSKLISDTYNFRVYIYYNSMNNEFKFDMAALVKPGYVCDIAENGPTYDFQPSSIYITPNNPSVEIQEKLENFLIKGPSTSLLNSDQAAQFQQDFIENYRQKGLRNKTQWTLKLNGARGIKLTVSKDNKNNVFIITLQCPMDSQKFSRITKTNPAILYVDHPDNIKLEEHKKANIGKCAVFRVEDHFSHYRVYDGSGLEPIYQGNNIANLVKKFDKRLKDESAIYLDMKDFAPYRLDPFSTSIKIQQQKQNAQISIYPIPRVNGSTGDRDLLLTPGNIKMAPGQSFTNLVEEKKEGGLKKIYHVTLQFLVTIGRNIAQRIHLTISCGFKDVPLRFLSRILEKASGSGYNGSLAAMVHDVRREILDTSENLSEKDVLVEFKNQYGNVHFVLIIHSPSIEDIQAVSAP